MNTVLFVFVYLIIEIIFNAYLIDTMSHPWQEGTIDSLTHYGRLLSGIGAALIVFKIFYRRISIRSALVLSLALAVPTVYYGERLLIEALAKLSTPEQRFQAVRAQTARQMTYLNAATSIAGASELRRLSGDGGTVFRALSGTLAYLQIDPLGINETAAAQKLAIHIIDGRLEDWHARYSEGFGSSRGGLRYLYQEYLKIERDYQQESARVKADPRIWRYPESRYDEAVRARVINYLPKPYDSGIGSESWQWRQLGLPHGLTWKGFLRTRVIADIFPHELKGYDLSILPAGLTKPAFRTWLIEHASNWISATAQRLRPTRIGSYEDGGEFAQEGIDAVKAVLIPPVGMTASLLFALLNIDSLVNPWLSARFSRIARCHINPKRHRIWMILGWCGPVRRSTWLDDVITPIERARFRTQRIGALIQRTAPGLVHIIFVTAIILIPYTIKINPEELAICEHLLTATEQRHALIKPVLSWGIHTQVLFDKAFRFTHYYD